MSVYVDPLIVWGGDSAPRCFQYKPSCHMYADTLEELHAMAAAIGMKRAWFQAHPLLPHYDLVPAKRVAAVHLGAVEHDRQQLAAFMREHADRARLLKSLRERIAAIIQAKDLGEYYGRLDLTETRVLREMVERDVVGEAVRRAAECDKREMPS